MNILGLGFTDHETSAALVIDGVLTTVIARERLSRIKKDGKRCGSNRMDLTNAIQYCLDANGLGTDDIDLVAWSHIEHLPSQDVFSRLASEDGLDISRYENLVLSHHFAHACCSYYLSPFAAAAVLVADGAGGPLHKITKNYVDGEAALLAAGNPLIQNLPPEGADSACEHESFYTCDNGIWRVLRKVVGKFNGIGAEYGLASQSLFGNILDAGKTMGLAPFGRRSEEPLFLKDYRLNNIPVFGSKHSSKRTVMDAQINQMRAWGSNQVMRDRYADLTHRSTLGLIMNHNDPANSEFAASAQAEAELALLTYARWLKEASGVADLCLSGGVAQNCVANSMLARESGFSRLFIPAAPGDDGIAVGCALYASAVHGELNRAASSIKPFLGRGYEGQLDMAKAGLSPLKDKGDLYSILAERLAKGAVVAWFQGGSEMGPRALGHRSFLADPRNPNMRDHLNRIVKNREDFRPFAPVVAEESVLDYFEEHYPSYYMSFVATVRKEKRKLLPAVTHVDGTARYQVLRRVNNPELYLLLEAFGRRTGIPILLNTSFNRAGEPLVETPAQAVTCFLASSADVLVVNGNAYQAERSH